MQLNQFPPREGDKNTKQAVDKAHVQLKMLELDLVRVVYFSNGFN